MMLLRSAFEGTQITFVTTLEGLGERAGLESVHIVPDCNRHEPLRAALCAAKLLVLLVKIRPHVLVSTGALPGVLAMMLARRMRTRTIWIDSIANAEEPSMAGRQAKRHATEWLSQWPEVALREGGRYEGSVL